MVDFLGAGRRQRTQVVGGLQTAEPGHAIGDIQLLAAGVVDVQVQRLRLVDPLLATAGRIHQPARFHLEGGGVDGLQVFRECGRCSARCRRST